LKLLQEVLDKMERAERVGNGSDTDMVQVAALKLADATITLYSGCKELQHPCYYLSIFMKYVQDRLIDTYRDQYIFFFLQFKAARKNRGEALRNLQVGV
jgi:hypothetical protein